MTFGRKPLSATPGKRFLGRLRVRLPARVETLTRTRLVILLDVSGGGARVQFEGAPPAGEVLLRWAGNEAHGRICWQRGGLCGVAFDHRVRQEALLATARTNEASALPEDLDLTTAAARSWADGSIKFGFD